MKKILIFVVIIFVFGYVIFQNGPRWLLQILATSSGTGSHIPAGNGANSPKPPFKDGTYTGSTFSAFYGNIQTQAIITGGKLTAVLFLQYPHDMTRSIAINTLAMPNLQTEAIQAQSANVNIVSGATDTSNAFIQSLSSALSQAK